MSSARRPSSRFPLNLTFGVNSKTTGKDRTPAAEAGPLVTENGTEESGVKGQLGAVLESGPTSADPLKPDVADGGSAEMGLGDLIPRLRKQGYSPDSVKRRGRWLEQKTGASLKHVGCPSFDFEVTRGNIENPIGVAQVPMGVAGPILVRGMYAQGLFYVPMATSEGALIRSYERGMVALTHAGGVETALLEDENHICPSFSLADIASAKRFADWVPKQLSAMGDEVARTTRHGRLNKVKCYQLGRQVIIDFGLETGDAQGMNMIVNAVDAVSRWIEASYPVSERLVFSGMSSEKRASGYLMIQGKGKRVTAGTLLSHKILKAYLHVTASQLCGAWHSTVIGHLQAGSVGYNIHCANGLAAIFIATGQDVANVVNSACAITSFELHEDGVFASITLPALSVATVGGGTALPTQQEALGVMDCQGSGKARKFAEIVAAALLGGEISMGAALASGEFAAAHEKYGRNRPR